jgi:hypothetical protein
MDKDRNDDIYRELNAVPLLDYLEKYRHNWVILLNIIFLHRWEDFS